MAASDYPPITDAEKAAQLPIGTVISTGLYAARRVADCFKGGRAGWLADWISGPLSDRELMNFGKAWTVARKASHD